MMKSSIRRAQTRGFTIVELMISVTVVAILTVLAYPLLNRVTHADAMEVCDRIERAVNTTKIQALRRHRAYAIAFTDMNGSAPQGLLRTFELQANHCRDANQYESQGQLIFEIPFGETTVPQDFSGKIYTDLGLAGFQESGSNSSSASDLVLCVTPSGAISRVQGNVATPIAGRLQVHVQGFEGGAISGPAYRVEMTYGGPARRVME